MKLAPMPQNERLMESVPLSFNHLYEKGASWETPVSEPLFAWMQPLGASVASACRETPRKPRKAHAKTRCHSKAQSQVCMDGRPSTSMAPAAIAASCEDAQCESRPLSAPKQSRPRRSRSEVPVYAVSAGTKHKAVSALQQFFFDELSRGNDANGAAAKALTRLNSLASSGKGDTSVSTPKSEELFPSMSRTGRKQRSSATRGSAESEAALDDESSDEEADFHRQRQERKTESHANNGSRLIRPPTPVIGQHATRQAVRVVA